MLTRLLAFSTVFSKRTFSMLTIKDVNAVSHLVHQRARLNHPAYEKCGVHKFPVIFAEHCLWSTPYPEYKPTEFTHERILEQPDYADPKDPKEIDWSQRRASLEYERQGKKMQFDAKGRPVNPIGRTGMTGRGRMGKWGCDCCWWWCDACIFMF
jgi:hypothetical protein